MFLDKQWNEKPINRQQIKSKPIIEKNYNKNLILDSINTLEELYTYIKNYDIDLKEFAKSTVIYSGPNNAEIMIIGEAPGKNEDDQGIPFVGNSGTLVNQLLEENNIKRDNVYVTNVLFWRPENNRTPTDNEIIKMRPILYKHIELYQPKTIILLGSVALRTIFENQYTITKIRGKLLSFQNIKVIATFHPSYIFRNKSMLDYMKEDFKTALLIA